MKVFIWISCYFVLSIVLTFIRSAGVILGGIPTVLLYLGTFFLAKFLCEIWDERKAEKTEKNEEN